MVYLVGAGPGDPELLTLKGKRLISQAEVLVYDRLASPEFLKLAQKSCETIYVGKSPGHHSMKQEEINDVLVQYALAGKCVVRLKGGDPFVFGRGGEEILALEQHEIPYEVVPGVTSAIAALADAGIPVTHRGIGQSFHVITGHTAAKALSKDVDDQTEDTLTDGFEAYAKLSGTLVFLMGLENLELIVERLIQNGKASSTPAAVVTDGTLKTMRCVHSTLEKLPIEARKAGLRPPGIIVVGPVADFRMTAKKQGMLFGLTVGITGTDAMYEKIASALGKNGASTVRIGAMSVHSEKQEVLKETVKKISGFCWIVFTSRNAVREFFAAVREAHVDLRTFSRIRFAVIGRGTAAYLETFGFYADYMPEEYTSKALAEGLCAVVNSDEPILIPRAVQGSRVLPDSFDKAGISYLELPIYDVSMEPVTMEELQGLDVITFESGSGVRGFFSNDPEKKRELLNTSICPLCIGQVTAEELKKYGVTQMLAADDFTAEGICEKLMGEVPCVRAWKTGKNWITEERYGGEGNSSGGQSYKK